MADIDGATSGGAASPSPGAGSEDPLSRLREMRAVTARLEASLVASFEGIVDASTDVSTDDEHDPEGHTLAWERQQIAALVDDARATLGAIEVAEHRLRDGTYGTCTTCGRPIAVERLAALPATSTCVTCAP